MGAGIQTLLVMSWHNVVLNFYPAYLLIQKQADATRVLMSCYLNEDFYDVIDIDSFGR